MGILCYETLKKGTSFGHLWKAKKDVFTLESFVKKIKLYIYPQRTHTYNKNMHIHELNANIWTEEKTNNEVNRNYKELRDKHILKI